MDNKGSWCQVWGPNDKAIAFNPLEPTVDMIHIATIAHSLAKKCRFNGMTNEFFSVAQHSIMVSQLCDKKDALWGLLHDAAEAYLVDVPRPIKRSKEFEAYLKLEDKIQLAICEKFNLAPQMPDSVMDADDLVLQWEWRDNMQPKIAEIFTDLKGVLDDKHPPLMFLNPMIAENSFLGRYAQLMAKRD